MQQAAPQAQARAYVDDLTAYLQGRREELIPFCVQGETTTVEFEARTGLQLSRAKSVVFATTAGAIEALRPAMDALPVSGQVRDLGVVHRFGQVRGPHPVEARLATAAIRLSHLWQLPVSFPCRLQLAQASVVAVASYGVASQGGFGHLRRFSSAVAQGILRGSRMVAPEAVYALFGSWRTNPQLHAVIGPFLAIQRAIGRGLSFMAWPWRTLGAGPQAAASWGCLRRPVRGWVLWFRTRGDGSFRTSAWTHVLPPAVRLQELLVDSWNGIQWRQLARRRKAFAGAANGVDRSLSTLGLSALPPDQAGALRALLCGDIITQRQVARWKGTATCPACLAADEDLEHRLWACPAWDKQRHQASRVHGWDPVALRAALPPLTALTGLVPALPCHVVGPTMRGWVASLPSREGPPWPELLATDGSCLFPSSLASLLLRRRSPGGPLPISRWR